MRVVLSLVLWLAACGDDGSTPATDGGADAADGSMPVVAAPAPPVLTPCPEGWSEMAVGPATVCEPYGGGSPDACPPRQVHLPGRPGCELLDGPCPAGDFADDLPDDGVIYVLEGATSGDGTRASPFATIGEALAIAGDGDVVAIGKGTYDEVSFPSAGVTLRGACTAETTLTSPLDARIGGVIHVAERDVTIQGLSVAATGRHGISVAMGGTLTIADVAVDEATEYGLIVVGDGSRVTADGLALHRTQVGDTNVGLGIGIGHGGVVEATRTSIREATDAGINVLGEGSRLSLTDALVFDTAGTPGDGGRGFGVEVLMGASVELDRVVVERMREAGIFAWQEGSATIRASVFRNNIGREGPGDFGCAIASQLGGVLTVERTFIDRTPDLGIFLVAGTGEHHIEDVVLRDIATLPSGLGGHGIGTEEDARLTIRRAYVERATSMAMAFFGSNVVLEDVDIVDTRENGDMEQGVGLLAALGTVLEGDRISIRGARDVGLYAADDTALTVRDLRVEDVESRGVDGRYGRGIDIERGTVATIERALVRNVRSVGLFAGDRGAVITVTDFFIEGVEPERCADTTCPSNHVAVGMGSYSTAQLTATRFGVDGSALCGVQVGPLGEMDLSMGTVSRSSVGACVLSDAFEIERLTRGVEFRDNDVNLDVSGALPVPEPAIIEDE